jgi:hypothetical protein
MEGRDFQNKFSLTLDEVIKDEHSLDEVMNFYCDDNWFNETNLLTMIRELFKRRDELNVKTAITTLVKQISDIRKQKSHPVCVLCFANCECPFGNNPFPLSKEGRCCNRCNEDVVMERMKSIFKLT